MRALLDILHPAHVHFFRAAISELKESGHTVSITSRDKDLTHRLLESFGLHHTSISRESKSASGLAWELAARNLRMLRIARDRRPHVMASIGGISSAQVGFLLRVPNVIFYDTEHATLSNLLSYPFASEVVTPSCYRGRVWGTHRTYHGYHELAYLRPGRFSPDAAVLEEFGVDPRSPFSVVRFVSWRAVHDVKARGLSLANKRRLVDVLSRHGRVFITSEGPLQSDLEPYRLVLAPEKVHHLLAFAQLFIGESATMASESAILGTPAVYVDAVGRGYTDELEHRYGLCTTFRPWQFDAALAKGTEVLSTGLKKLPSFTEAVKRMISETADVTEVIVESLLRVGEKGSGSRAVRCS